MFRESKSPVEVRVSHDLSGRINIKKNEKLRIIDSEGPMDSKIEMKYAG